MHQRLGTIRDGDRHLGHSDVSRTMRAVAETEISGETSRLTGLAGGGAQIGAVTGHVLDLLAGRR